MSQEDIEATKAPTGRLSAPRDKIVSELAPIDRAGGVEDIQELDRPALVVVVPVDEMRRDFEGRIRKLEEFGFRNAARH